MIGMPQCQNASYCSIERSAIHLNSAMAFLNKQTISLSMACDDFRQSFAQQLVFVGFVAVVVVVVVGFVAFVLRLRHSMMVLQSST